MVGRDQTPTTRTHVFVRSHCSINTPCHCELEFCPIGTIFAASGGSMDGHPTHYSGYVASVFAQLYQASQPHKPDIYSQILSPAKLVVRQAKFQ